jgi:SAM-dependent methyltransferase
MKSEDTGLVFLEHLNEARRLNQWIYDYIEPYLGRTVLEVGCGIGNVTEFLVSSDRRRVVSIDIEPEYVEIVARKFQDRKSFRALRGDITDGSFVRELAPAAYDTVVCLNVLEHIRDDEQTLESFRDLLTDNGRLILLCPAHPRLYGTMDQHLGHFRRYSRKGLEALLVRIGFKPVAGFHFNSFSVPGWFINGKILGRRHASPAQIRIVELVVPFFRFWEDRIKLPFGLSILTIARK